MNKPKRITLSIEETFAYLDGLSDDDAEILLRYFSKDIDFLGKMDYSQSKKLGKHLVALGKMDPPIEQTDAERIEMWGRYGLAVGIPLGRSPFSDSMMLAEHDGVPYCVDESTHLLRDGSDHYIQRKIAYREMIIDCYHEKIRSVHEYCTTLGCGPVWVMVGGGDQVQAFFGNDRGYLAILFLDHYSTPHHTEAERERLRRKNHVLQPQLEHNERLLGGVKLPGVKVEFYGRSPSPMD